MVSRTGERDDWERNGLLHDLASCWAARWQLLVSSWNTAVGGGGGIRTGWWEDREGVG